MRIEELHGLRVMLGRLRLRYRTILGALIQGEELTPEELLYVSQEDSLQGLLRGFVAALIDAIDLRHEAPAGNG